MEKELIEQWKEYLDYLKRMHKDTDSNRSFECFMTWLEIGYLY